MCVVVGCFNAKVVVKYRYPDVHAWCHKTSFWCCKLQPLSRLVMWINHTSWNTPPWHVKPQDTYPGTGYILYITDMVTSHVNYFHLWILYSANPYSILDNALEYMYVLVTYMGWVLCTIVVYVIVIPMGTSGLPAWYTLSPRAWCIRISGKPLMYMV